MRKLLRGGPARRERSPPLPDQNLTTPCRRPAASRPPSRARVHRWPGGYEPSVATSLQRHIPGAPCQSRQARSRSRSQPRPSRAAVSASEVPVANGAGPAGQLMRLDQLEPLPPEELAVVGMFQSGMLAGDLVNTASRAMASRSEHGRSWLPGAQESSAVRSFLATDWTSFQPISPLATTSGRNSHSVSP
jgi:hypothetical protein